MIQVDEAQVCLRQAQTYWHEQNWQLTIQACAKALALNQKLTEAHKLMGDALQRIGKNKEAIGYYVQAIAIEPNFAEVYANLGALYAKQKEWDQAIVHYQKAIKAKPDFVAVYRQLAKVYKIQQQPEKAQAYLSQAIAKEKEQEKEPASLPETETQTPTNTLGQPQSLNEYLQQGQVLKQQGELKAALQQYLKAASIEPQRVQTYNEIVTLCEQLELWSEAAKYCRLILKLSNSPNSISSSPTISVPAQASTKPQSQPVDSPLAKAEYHYNLGTMYGGKQEWSKAIEQYQQALAINPRLAKAHRNLSRALAQSGNKQQSLEYLFKALTIDNEGVSGEEYLELAQNLASWGKPDSAIVCYRRALERQPDSLAAYLGWGELLVKEGFKDEAIACYVEGLKHIQDGELYYRLGCLYRAKEQWSQATLCYQKATQYLPEHGAAYHELGEVLSHQEVWTEAIPAYRQAIKFRPDFSWSYNNLGYALIQLGQWTEAIPVYQEAIKLNPEFPWSYYNLAEAHSKLNRWDEAVKFFQQTAKIQPDLPSIQQKLGDALYNRSLQDKDLALQHFNLAIKQNPHNPEAYHQALAIDKTNLEYYLQLGDILAEQGQTEEAIVTYQMALGVQPKNSEAIARLQKLLPQQDRNQNVHNVVQPSVSVTPQIIDFSQADLKF